MHSHKGQGTDKNTVSNNSPADVKKSSEVSAPGLNPFWQKMAFYVPVQAKLTIGQANDPYEQEADEIADKVVNAASVNPSGQQSRPQQRPYSATSPAQVQRICDQCQEKLLEGEDHHCQAKHKSANRSETPGNALQQALASPGRGTNLPSTVRGPIESQLKADLSSVRVHNDKQSHKAAEQINAKAFTHNQHIFLGKNQSSSDLRLMAHEATHVVQQSNQGSASAIQRKPVNNDPLAGTMATQREELVAAIRTQNTSGVTAALQNKSVPQLKSLRATVKNQNGVVLEIWLSKQVNNAAYLQSLSSWAGLFSATPTSAAAAAAGQVEATAEQGLRLLWPALGMVDRMAIYDEGFRQIEEAQLDVIRSFSAEQRISEQGDARLTTIFSHMSPEQEFQARVLINPAQRYQATEKLLERASGFISDTEDPLFNAILRLSPTQRKQFWQSHIMSIYNLLSHHSFHLLQKLVHGSEAQAIHARLRLATEGRFDDKEGIQEVANRLRELLEEKRNLRQQLAQENLDSEQRANIDSRLAELEGLESLLQFQRNGNQLVDTSFMGQLAAASSSAEQFAQYTSNFETAYSGQQLAEYRLEVTRQRIIMAESTFGIDEEEIETALIALTAPLEPGELAGLSDEEKEQRQNQANNRLRQRLLDDPQIDGIIERIRGVGGVFARGHLRQLGQLSPFDEQYRGQFTDAVNHRNWGEVFRLALVFAKRDDWRELFRAKAIEPGAPSAYARIQGTQRDIVDSIVEHRTMPILDVLRFTGNLDTLRPALGQIDEDRRSRLRLGYWINRESPEPDTLTHAQRQALAEFNTFQNLVIDSQTTLGIFVDQKGIQDVLDLVLGNVPTQSESATGTGRMRAADILHHRQTERLALDRGLVTPMTETDETMDASAREFAALYQQLRERGTLTSVEFSQLAALHARFESRSNEFNAASDAVSEMGAMVAATVAAMVVVAVSGGTASPGVIAMAAAAGGGTRVFAKKVLEGANYNPASEEGARDLLIGAVDGALAVIGSNLAARGVELLGLSGQSMATAAARMGEEVAELAALQASQTLGRKVVISGIEGAFDGALSSFVSDAVKTMTDANTWRKGVWHGIVNTGQAALIGGLTGLGSGAVMGGVMPVAGDAANRMWSSLTGDTVERIARHAGPHAREALDATRRALDDGDYEQARRLLAELEGQLSPQQARALREALGLEGQLLQRADNLSSGLSSQQKELLEETRLIDDGKNLSQQQLDNEIDIVRRSQPVESELEGYIDEVDLGNGHTWRRREDGTWCRFSSKSLCGKQIDGARPFARPRFFKDGPPPDFDVVELDAFPTENGIVAPLKAKTIYKFPGGHSVWKDANGIHHDSVLGPSTGRQGFEKQFYSAGEHGQESVKGMHRAHTLGQGTGFESPYGIYYAPAEVNLIVQNNGIEEFMRGLYDALPPGARAHVKTVTKAHPKSLRLREIRYQLEIDLGNGEREFLFEYVINVSDGVNPRVTHGVANVTQRDDLARIFDDIDVPDRINKSWARRHSGQAMHRAIRAEMAENFSDVLPLVGKPVTGTELPSDYFILRRDGRTYIHRKDANDTKFEPLTTKLVDGQEVIELRYPPPT